MTNGEHCTRLLMSQQIRQDTTCHCHCVVNQLTQRLTWTCEFVTIDHQHPNLDDLCHRHPND